ncbi:MAG: hypothetical protein ACYCWE_20785 [Eubacteriales bacterium]
MPGNLLFADKQFPNVTGDNSEREAFTTDMKAILNYLYMLQEELRYTMGNLGIENFNTQELNNILSSVDDGSLAEIKTQADEQGASIELLAAYTGLTNVVVVSTLAERTDITKTYKIGVNYYRYNGSAWVVDTSIVSAALTLAAINGQSVASLNASKINFTGFTTFVRPADLSSTGTTTVDGGRVNTNTLATLALKKRIESNLNWLDFYAGIDMTVINVKDTAYYPDTRQIIGLKNLRLYKDTGLVSGHGAAGNSLVEIGSLQVNTTGITTMVDSWSSGLSLFMVDTDYPTALELSSGSGVAISSGKAMYQSGPIVLTAYNDSIKNSGYSIRVTKVAIQLWKYTSGTATLLQQWV